MWQTKIKECSSSWKAVFDPQHPSSLSACTSCLMDYSRFTLFDSLFLMFTFTLRGEEGKHNQASMSTCTQRYLQQPPLAPFSPIQCSWSSCILHQALTAKSNIDCFTFMLYNELQGARMACVVQIGNGGALIRSCFGFYRITAEISKTSTREIAEASLIPI